MFTVNPIKVQCGPYEQIICNICIDSDSVSILTIFRSLNVLKILTKYFTDHMTDFEVFKWTSVQNWLLYVQGGT